jgi:predicted Zn-ribbon and HTH transcriptional regulator
MMEFIWNMHQEGRIAEAKAEAAEAKDEVTRYRERIKELEFRLDRMALASQALWELLRSRLGLSEAELLAKINEIDLRDGVQDQRMTARPMPCAECGRTLNSKASRCIYCGAVVAKPHVFQ